MADRPQSPTSSPPRTVVDVFLAEDLAAADGRLDSVQIRECLEGEPRSRAEGLIRWAKRRAPRNPYRKLRQWARRNERGFYSPKFLRRDASVVYKEYLAYAEIKRREHQAATGAPVLSPDRLDAVTSAFYGPRGRADLARISPAAWAQFHEEEEREEEDAVA